MNSRDIAHTILEQLGGQRFGVMTGAHTFSYNHGNLQFRIGRNCKSVNCVDVQLDPSDTYTVTFYRVSNGRKRGPQVKVLAKVADVYCDNLRRVFTMHTGMETSLGTLGA